MIFLRSNGVREKENACSYESGFIKILQLRGMHSYDKH